MWVAQSWDDGVVDDLRLTTLLRQHQVPATFNLNPGLHQRQRSYSWQYGDKEIWRLGQDELTTVYADFNIANHSLTHPYLSDLSAAAMQREVVDSRHLLQDWLQQPVTGFCYPFGAFTPAVKDAVGAAGHIYARTVLESPALLPIADRLELAVSCHFNSPHFWQRYAQAQAAQSGFLFWGHSYELINEVMWADLEQKILAINADAAAEWTVLDAWFGLNSLRENAAINQ